MNNFIRNNKKLTLIFCVLIAAVIIAVSFIIFINNRVKILDRSEFRAITEKIQQDSANGVFTDQASLRDFITSWADENGLKYKVDSNNNIIFNSRAASLKKNVSPTVICVSYNYETISSNAELLASAAMIARTDLKSGRKTVVFVNNSQDLGKGYKGLSKKYFSGKSKVIYMDYGESSYISRSSFCRQASVIDIPSGREKVKCDTAVKVHISGITSDEINTNVSNHPDPISAFGALLTRLKTKSVTFQLADFETGCNGQMYPVSIDACFVLNSYSVNSFTKYIDKKSKDWQKDYSADFPEISYTYEVIDDPDDLPEKAYSAASVSKLTNVLYTVKNGTYHYAADDDIPENHKEGDVFGINCTTGLRSSDGSICLDILSMAYNGDCLDRINSDNMAAAELFKCSWNVTESVPAFMNEKDSLLRTLTTTFEKVNRKQGKNSILEEKEDYYFTPCAYISGKGDDNDIIHLRLSPKRAANLTNMILCYIATKGNFLSL